MGDGVVDLLVQGDISLLHVLIIIRTQRVVASFRQSRLAERLISPVDVVAAQSFQPRVRDDRDGRVAFHRVSFSSEEFPFRHPAVFVVHGNHRADHVALPVRIDECQQLMHVAVGVPQREDRISVPLLHRADVVALHGRVLSVDIL